MMETVAQGVLHCHPPRKHERQLSVAIWVPRNLFRPLDNTIHQHLQSLMLGHNVNVWHPGLNRGLQRSERGSCLCLSYDFDHALVVL